jgi:pyruvate dehydrogenase E2 component (dihydrolipoamide acetyltransferase)
MREFKLPDPGEGLVEAEIVAWKVKVGDTVAVNDLLLEIETAKSLVELPSPYAGVVAELLVAEGDTVEVGTPIIRIEDGVAAPAERPGDTGEPPAQRSGEPLVEPVETTAEPLVEPVETTGGVSTSSTSDTGATGDSGATSDTGSPSAEISSAAVTGNVQDDLGEVPVSTSDGSDASGSMLVGYGAKAASIARRPRRAAAVAVPTPATDQVHESYDTANPVSRHTDDVTPSGRLSARPSGEQLPPPGRPQPQAETGRPSLAKPPVRRIARDLGVDLSQVAGSGPGGTITAQDVLNAAQGGRPGSGDRRVQLRGIRREMFRSMTESLKVPQATAFVEVDVTGTMELIDNLRQRREFAGLRVSPLLVFGKAACLAIARNPEINSSFDAETEEVILHGDVNLGIAAATPRGLVVPNIKRADRMNLLELAQSLNEMVAVAKQGRVQPGDLSLGTFTITNVGVFGVDGGTPIMNPGEAAIMCLGTVRRKPWVVGTGADEHIEPRSVCTVSLTFDHRLVDGEMGSKFLADVATIMTDPGLSLLY